MPSRTPSNPEPASISGRQSTDRGERLAGAYFDYALSGIIETDDHGQVLKANPAAASILERDARLLEGKPLLQVFSPSNHARFNRHWLLLREQGISHVETGLTLADGRELVIQMASIQIDDTCYMHVFDDVTTQRQAEQEIERARIAAESANRAKSEFLANISHEIRTPLNGILGLSHLALQFELPPQVQGYLAGILSSGQRLHGLVTDIMDAATIESGHFRINSQPYRLTDVLADLEDLRTTGMREKPLTVEFIVEPGLPEGVMGDHLRVVQCLRKLVGNAIKFTPAGKVSLKVGSLQHEGRRWLQFCVSDTGIGITPDQMSRLFAPFSQADTSVARQYGGSGLGLYLVRQMVRHMGGSLEADSNPGEGSSFAIRLPLEVAELPTEDRFEFNDVPDEFRGRRLLVVEDDEVNRLMIGHALKKAGIECRFARNGQEAIDLAQEQPLPALILMDIQMPVLDGLSATRALRVLGCTIPIIGLSAGTGVMDESTCIAAGMHDFLPKPLILDDLWGTLTRWLPPMDGPGQGHTGTLGSFDDVHAQDADSPFLEDEAMMAHLKHTFVLTHGKAGARVKALVHQGDRRHAAFMVHTLKSAAALVGLNEAATLARELEPRLIDASEDYLAMQCVALQQMLDRFADLENLPEGPHRPQAS